MQSPIEALVKASQSSDWTNMLLSPLAGIGDLTQLVFFQRIYAFLNDEINEFMQNLVGRTMAMVGTAALLLMTIWILIQGYRILSGQSRESMVAFTYAAARNAFVIITATSMALFSSDLADVLGNDLPAGIHFFVTGINASPFERIDESLGYMQLAMSSIDAINVGGSGIIEDAKNRAQWFSGLGIAAPAVTGGAMLMIYRIAIALFVGFGPIFIMCLMFDYTKSLFQKWLLYGIGMMFSLAVMSVMVTLAMDAIIAVAASFWVGSFLGASNEGITSQAMQQGGLGLFMTALIVSAPPMAAQFFQGTLGSISAYSAFGNYSGGSRPGAQPGQPGYNPSSAASANANATREANAGRYTSAPNSSVSNADVVKQPSTLALNTNRPPSNASNNIG